MTADPVSREIPLDDVLRFMRLIWAVDHELERVSKRMEDRIGLTIPQRLSLLLSRRTRPCQTRESGVCAVFSASSWRPFRSI